ncbi:hypothetical protein [Hyphomicrobium sp.]|uniref:hypothetical protein n=1 Tax=Hyphomicrobium sp. TaxID=82 RepID=UPI000FA8C079|nr:hypothetical protein [Hyphomicrobium sp.]RUP08381.1 MAG: hypothetical protein EKK38_14195 [Hyphomicrobium sp.]
MRIASWAVAGALTILGTTAAFATTPAFEDNKLNFKGCDGAQVSVRWLGDDFQLSAGGKVLGKERASFEFVGWDGKCSTARWATDQAKFAVGADASASSSSLIRFMATDGSRWLAMRDGDGFFVARIAANDEEISSPRITEIAAWLERSSREYSPGRTLAKHLKTEVIAD